MVTRKRDLADIRNPMTLRLPMSSSSPSIPLRPRPRMPSSRRREPHIVFVQLRLMAVGLGFRVWVALILAEDRENLEEALRHRQTNVTWLCRASRNSLLCSAQQRLIEACCLENRAGPFPKTYAANRNSGCIGCLICVANSIEDIAAVWFF